MKGKGNTEKFKIIHGADCLGLKYVPEQIETKGVHHQTHQQEETNRNGFFHELIAHFAAGNDFPQEEYHITAIECRNRQEVHEGEDDTERGCKVPEFLPGEFRSSREHIADADKTAKVFIGRNLTGKHFAKSAQLAFQKAGSLADTFRERLEEGEILSSGFHQFRNRFGVNTYGAFFREGEIDGKAVGTPENTNFSGFAFIALRLAHKLVLIEGRRIVKGDQPAVFLDTCCLCR